jgi:hypothetical protein
MTLEGRPPNPTSRRPETVRQGAAQQVDPPQRTGAAKAFIVRRKSQEASKLAMTWSCGEEAGQPMESLEHWIESQPYCRSLGIRPLSAHETRGRFHLAFMEENSNPGQALHGGVAGGSSTWENWPLPGPRLDPMYAHWPGTYQIYVPRRTVCVWMIQPREAVILVEVERCACRRGSDQSAVPRTPELFRPAA